MLLRNTRTAARRSARLARTGFTLMEVLVVVAIIVILAGVGGYYLMGRLSESKESIAKVNVKTLSNACEQYNVKYSRWPASLAELTTRQADGGRKYVDADAIVDPWGKPYQYNPQGPRNDGDRPDVWTVSPDGKEIGNWPTGR